MVLVMQCVIRHVGEEASPNGICRPGQMAYNGYLAPRLQVRTGNMLVAVV
jgi:hypothetical protein